MKEVYPDLVSADENGILSINYVGLIPVMIEAIKEQQVKIETLDAQLNTCCASTNSNSTFNETTGISNINKSSLGTLQQNTPNPFSQNTHIAFSISTQATNAMINIYDLQGTEIKSYPISAKGSQSITIQGSDLKAGMYFYTLIVDGKEVDTKRMILTK